MVLEQWRSRKVPHFNEEMLMEDSIDRCRSWWQIRGLLALTAILLPLVTWAQSSVGIPSIGATSLAELKAGVVKITTHTGGTTKVGTGVIVRVESGAAYIVTAAHVIEGDPDPQVQFFSQPARFPLIEGAGAGRR